MKKILGFAGAIALSIIPTPSFSHGNAKYSACAFSRVVSGIYGGKAENAIFYCWDPNDPPLAGVPQPSFPNFEPAPFPNFEPAPFPDFEPAPPPPFPDFEPAPPPPPCRQFPGAPPC